jgi:hypothetical protein
MFSHLNNNDVDWRRIPTVVQQDFLQPITSTSAKSSGQWFQCKLEKVAGNSFR